MLKSLSKLVGTQTPKTAGTINVEPHRGEMEFVLVLVESGSDQQAIWTIGSVSEDAAAFHGIVLQITGPLLFIAFSGVAGQAAPSRRIEFVERIIREHRILLRVLHGRRGALIGDLGGETRRTYTAMLDGFNDLLGQLARLHPGESAET